jgi:hypothetical protein
VVLTLVQRAVLRERQVSKRRIRAYESPRIAAPKEGTR